MSSVLKTVVGAFLPGLAPPPAAAAVTALAPLPAPVFGPPLLAAPGVIPGLAPGVSPVGVRKQTLVQTLNAQNQVIRTQILPGSPFLMNKDIVAAKRVFRLSSKLSGKLPRKTVKESKITQLKDAAVDSALKQIIAPKPCP